MSGYLKRLSTVGSEAGSANKLKMAKKQTSPFTVSGKFDDEVKLVFDDKKELYVSKNFLILSSPVFEAMFKNDFSEKRDNLVRLPGKKYEDFLAFLDCMNPGSLQDVKDCSMIRIAPIAEEYQVNSVAIKCKASMKDLVLILKRQLKKTYVSYQRCPEHQQKSLLVCLNLLHSAITCCYQDIIEPCIEIAACYSSRFYRLHTDNSEIQQLFRELPAEIRYRILWNRLYFCENNKVFAYSGK